ETLVGSAAPMSAVTSASCVATIAVLPSSSSVLSVTLASVPGAHAGGPCAAVVAGRAIASPATATTSAPAFTARPYPRSTRGARGRSAREVLDRDDRAVLHHPAEGPGRVAALAGSPVPREQPAALARLDVEAEPPGRAAHRGDLDVNAERRRPSRRLAE